MGRFAKQKGKRGEQEIATSIRIAFPKYAADIRRGDQGSGGRHVADINGLPGWHVEVKNTAKPNCLAALRQAIGDAKPGNTPIAVLKQNRSYTVCVMRWDDFLALLVEHERLKEIENGGHRVQAAGRWVLRKRGAKKRR